MAYIPEAHAKYNLLPFCVGNGGEVFDYPSSIANKITDEFLPDEESVIPYGYENYSQYYTKLDDYIIKYGTTDGKINEIGELIIRLKKDIQNMNIKENWSVLRYIGKPTDGCFGLTHGRYYYMTSFDKARKSIGIIDDEEFTAYMYPAKLSDWEVTEDPTGIASEIFMTKESQNQP